MPILNRLQLPLLFAALLLLSACAQYVKTPPLSPSPTTVSPEDELAARLARITPPVTGDGTEPVWLPRPHSNVKQPQVGDDLGHGITVTPELAVLFQASADKDWQYWKAALGAAERSLPHTPEAAYILSSQRIKTMIHAGRPAEAFEELARLNRIESDLFGDNSETLSQYGQYNFWLNRPDEAIEYYSLMLDNLGDWWIPTFYYGKPENIGNAKRLAGAMVRAYIGMSGAYVMKKDYRTAMAWGRLGLERAQDIIGISHHPIYGLFVVPTAYMYEGHAWMLTFYAAARLGVSGDREANQPLIDAAKAYFRQAQYRWGDLVVDSVIDFVAYDRGLQPQETARIGPLPEPGLATPERLAAARHVRPAGLETREAIALPIPHPDSIRLPGAGEVNSFNFTVSPALAKANAAFLRGEYGAAAGLYAAIARDEKEPLKRWHASAQAIKAMIAAGRSADALAALPANAELEQAFFGTNLGARALRGDAKFWLGDYDGAVRDYLQVAEALGSFRPPTLFVFPPQIPQLSLMNQAQFRAYLGIARALMYKGDYAAALPWAEAAEQLFEETHYAWQHELYRAYLKIDRDMFFGRGLNLAVMAAARLVLGQDEPQGQDRFAAAKAYLEAMSFASGLTTVDAIRARALLDAGRPADAEKIAAAAARFAAAEGQADLLWQVQALRGEALEALGRQREAERAFRAAQTAIEAISGALATDGSKRQFSIGKGDITRRLVAYDLGRKDYARAFADLEQGRARAFVDMVGQVQLARGRNQALVAKVRALDGRIRAARIRASAPGKAAPGLSAEVQRLAAERHRAVARLRRQSPELADALAISAQGLRPVQQRLGPRDLLLYTLPEADADAPIRFLAVRRGGASVLTTTLSHGEVETLLAPFTTDDPLGDAPLQQAAVETLSRGLGLADWQPAGTLYVVPSRSLYFLPWAAMPVRVPVVVLPTGGWLLRSPDRIATARAAIVGDPALGGDWESLPGARVEADDIAALYGVSAITGSAASVEALRARVGRGVRVLHLATHGVFNAREPLQSAILLSHDGGTERLTASDLFEQPLPATLVVMSACETGLGQVTAGDDFLGLARSFYLSGTHAVVNSLWPVHDKPTRRFMEVFHREAAGGDLGRAWLKARDTLKDEGLPPSVYGAFVLGGAARI
ncbi:MAG: CHAT domain-containing protein [Alphaproteobacteria bacterium]|nr:CHAT domain-containing protein [Alphaproteobacteria bacterium]MCB9928225.1 CHAT domain-containing protein [Alphaproteobacteria bacterium]